MLPGALCVILIVVARGCWQNRRSGAIRERPVLISDRGRIYQLFKYLVYAFLTANVYFFFAEEWAASAHRFSDGIELEDIIEGFTATIDTAAWVVLLLMFELETFVLDDKQFTRRVTWTLHGLRAICYGFIIYSFTGYVRKLIFLGASAPLAGVGDLCALVDGTWAYGIDIDEYEILTAVNCTVLSAAGSFMQFPGLSAVVDQAGLVEIIRLAWVDVINSGVWLLVVLVLEIDVRLQERNMLDGLFLRISNMSKFVLYGLLFLAAVYWGVKGDFVDFWDAFLWLVAFVFIELNVFDWRQEVIEEQKMQSGAPI
jgi:hypothetical protein